jgi:hypothetical protein
LSNLLNSHVIYGSALKLDISVLGVPVFKQEKNESDCHLVVGIDLKAHMHVDDKTHIFFFNGDKPHMHGGHGVRTANILLDKH